MSLLGRPRRKQTWDQLRERFHEAVPGATTATGDDVVWVAWHEGPSIATVQERIGDTPGWEWRAVAPGVVTALPPVTDAPTLWMRRSLGEAALARSVVRFFAAYTRYFTTDQDRYWQRFADICDEDVPAPVTYPIIEHITAALLTLPDPDPEAEDPEADLIDRLSGRLRRHGYDNLWAEAYKAVG